MGKRRKHLVVPDADPSAATNPSAATPMYVVKPRITHADLENNFNSYIRQSPEYAIRNLGTNPFYLIASLVIPNSRNTFLDRYHRLMGEKFYIVYSDWLDKASIVISLLSVLVGLTTVACEYSVGVHRVYVYMDPNDAADTEKRKKLDRLNALWTWWDLLKLLLAGAPSMIQGWRAFKRSSVPARGNETQQINKLKALTEKNRQKEKKNKLSITSVIAARLKRSNRSSQPLQQDQAIQTSLRQTDDVPLRRTSV